MGTRRALLIGVSEYADKAIISFPKVVENDIKHLSQALISSNYQVESINLNNLFESTRNGILVSVRTFLNKAKTGDILFIYFTGHGIHYNGFDYLIPSDGSLRQCEFYSEYLIKLDFHSEVESSQAKAVFFFIDACREGVDKFASIGAKGSLLTGWSASKQKQVANKFYAIVFACNIGQFAHYVNTSNEQFSLFTKALAKVIDSNHCSKKFGEVSAYTQEILSLLCRTYGKTTLQEIKYRILTDYAEEVKNLIICESPKHQDTSMVSEINILNKQEQLSERPESVKDSEQIKENKTIKEIELLSKMIKYIEQKETNYIFLFGLTNVGKTAIIASIIYYLSNPNRKFGDIEELKYEDDSRYEKTNLNLLNVIRKCIKDRRFPARTNVGSLSHINIKYKPISVSKPPISITFLDMSGNDLRRIEENTHASDKLPDNIDVFFKADKNRLSMLFILVTSHKDAEKDDQIMVNFLQHIISQDTRFKTSKVLLLISKWDTYHNDKDVKDFIKERMPLTWSKISNSVNGYSSFSLGTVKNVDGEPFIASYDEEPARKVFNWIYSTITGK